MKLIFKIFGSITGVVIAFVIINFSLRMISAKSTIENFVGLLLLILLISSVIVIGIKFYKSISKQLKTKN